MSNVFLVVLAIVFMVIGACRGDVQWSVIGLWAMLWLIFANVKEGEK